MVKCEKPDPDEMYSRDELKNIHFWCKNCGKEVMEAKQKGDKEFKWHHAHKEIIFD